MKNFEVLMITLSCAFMAAAEVSQIKLCAKANRDACTVTQLRVDPCPKYPCVLKQKRNASLSFDYIPNFNANQLRSSVYWADDQSETPYPPVGLVDGCLHSTCPTVSGTPNTFSYQLYIGKMVPTGSFLFRWKLWNEADPDQLCCFETRVKIKSR